MGKAQKKKSAPKRAVKSKSKPTLTSVPASTQDNAPKGPVIESGIAIPPMKSSGRWNFMEKMKVGDSFYLKKTECNIDSSVGSLRSAANRFNFKVTVRNDENGARVWRV